MNISAGKLCALVAMLTGSTIVFASSHSDAPRIKLDPQANLTDVYAFIGRQWNEPGIRVLNIIANVRPFSEPGDGPHYERFSPDARYSLHITHPVTGETVTRYDFTFSPVDSGYKNLDTILSYGLGTEVGPIIDVDDARQNYTQTYTVTKVEGGTSTVLATDLLVAPPNAGGNVTPLYNDADGKAVSGAENFGELDPYTQQSISGLTPFMWSFAGPRDDSFFADVPGIFDLLNVRILDNDGDLDDGLGQDGNGVDGFKGFNVLTIAMQINVLELSPNAFISPFFGEQMGVGVYASVSRPQTRILEADGSTTTGGPMVQVNRLGNPLFNEALVPLADKDNYNITTPADGDLAFATYAENPELALLINTVFKTSFATTGRADLVGIFIPDVLRVITTTDPVPLSGESGFHRLGFIGGDTTNDVSSGWPNGRRLGDDVIDIALTAVASGPTYDPITVVGDNTPINDIPYHGVFPYMATPHSGSNNKKDANGADLDGDGDVDLVDFGMFQLLFTGAQ